ncbi:MAG: prepilin-type N-terminal cleavage/methylation domain-containing protein, partial [Syntrophomonadaceae bacterium]|nr:prepilin-type N-terminal cleavage/methylation domain-containing protein [Syntrophomonadaceae bacterium]
MMWYKNGFLGIKPNGSGYTLVELLAVLAIISLLFVMAWPTYRSTAAKLALRQDASILARELRLARQTAITMGEECCVIFIASSAAKPSTTYQIRQGGDIRVVNLTRGVTIAGTSFARDPVFPSQYDRTACRFLPSGAPARGGTVHLK